MEEKMGNKTLKGEQGGQLEENSLEEKKNVSQEGRESRSIQPDKMGGRFGRKKKGQAGTCELEGGSFSNKKTRKR